MTGPDYRSVPVTFGQRMPSSNVSEIKSPMIGSIELLGTFAKRTTDMRGKENV